MSSEALQVLHQAGTEGESAFPSAGPASEEGFPYRDAFAGDESFGFGGGDEHLSEHSDDTSASESS